MKRFVPQLRYDIGWDRWVLSDPSLDGNDVSYEMVIDHSCEKDSFRFIRWEMGDWIEVIKTFHYKERIQSIVEHEGQEIANVWVHEQNQVAVVPDSHPVFKLQAYWEAMMELGLFTPSVTMRSWEGRQLESETLAKMNEIRERQMQEMAEEPHGF